MSGEYLKEEEALRNDMKVYLLTNLINPSCVVMVILLPTLSAIRESAGGT